LRWPDRNATIESVLFTSPAFYLKKRGWIVSRTPSFLGSLLAAIFALFSSSSRAGLPEAPPRALGFEASRLQRIDAAIDRAIERSQIPGAVVLVGRHGAIAYARAAGRRAVEPQPEAMTRDTVFDLASLTKPVATATAVMLLIDQGQLRLSDRLGTRLPELDNRGKGSITIEQLLRHRAGFIADNPLSDFEGGPNHAWQRIAALELESRPGERFRYSDVGFLVLGMLVERKAGRRLDELVEERAFRPLGMKDTHFRPLAREPLAKAGIPLARIAPTERESPAGRMLRGVVHDPRARALGGVAGHAGLFSTADDLAIFAQMLLNGGSGPDGSRILSPLAVRLMIDAAATPARERRALGWDVDTSFSAPRGDLFGHASFGHTGFTGTSIWIDPETDTFVVILTSRLHPDGKAPSPTALRAEIGTLAAAAIVDAPSRPIPITVPAGPDLAHAPGAPDTGGHQVRCGIDVLIEEGFRPLRDLRIGLVTNHTGRTRTGKSTIDVLAHAPRVKLIRLFSPEHGIRGQLDARVADSHDEATGLPIISLYGSNRKPQARDLEGIDALVYDIQDVGTRFYTYITTLGLVLEAAQASGKKVVVLDRPNPIGGRVVAGPVRDQEFSSFVAYHALPVRHGMTVGELARLYNAEREIRASLEVVPCRGWSRDDLYDRTGLVWINPSPNMRSLTEALLYPGVGLLEATNLATGRGTDTPFERLGAPWIDPALFAAALNAAGVPGARFVPIFFTPTQRQYAGQRCGGVHVLITDWGDFDSLRLGITLAVQLHTLYPKEWQPDGLLRLLADRSTYDDLLANRSVAQIMTRWQNELAEFWKVRSRYLLY
jgi:uncharacterized protein YbbC (DUF1343 family)/CubicO group peptidase (beta-lactamase class C family)